LQREKKDEKNRKPADECKDLLHIRIPAGVEIPGDAFAGCPNVVIDQKQE